MIPEYSSADQRGLQKGVDHTKTSQELGHIEASPVFGSELGLLGKYDEYH